MSTVAQSRDLSDRKTIENFAAVVQSLDRHEAADHPDHGRHPAVGPGVWNGWKAQLIRTLYYETEPVLTGGFSEVNRAERVAAAKAEFRDNDCAIGRPRCSKPMSPATIRRTGSKSTCRTSLRMRVSCARAEAAGKRLATSVGFDADAASPSSPCTRPTIPGFCRSSPAPVRSPAPTSSTRRSYTTTDGLALDTIAVSREFERDEDEARRAARIGDVIEKAVRGHIKLPDVVAKAGAAERPPEGFRHRAGGDHQQSMVAALHRRRSHRPRPARVSSTN